MKYILPRKPGDALILGSLFLAACLQAQTQSDGDERIPYSEVPLPVRESAEKILGAHSAITAEKETENGSTLYELSVTRGSGEFTLKYSETGDLIEEEEEVDLNALPKAIAQTLAKEYPNAEFTEAEKVKLHFYEIEMTVDGKHKEVRVFSSGAIETLDVEEDEELEEDDD